eukprot:jgi/Hompol1/6840/HPOL_000473-RA
MIQRRKGDLVALVLLGTEETRNPIAQDDGQYQNIVLHGYEPNQPPETLMKPMTIALLRAVMDGFDLGVPEGDGKLFDAILVAADVLKSHCKKLKFKKQIFVCASADGYLITDGFQDIIDIMNRLEIDLRFVGFDFPQIGDVSADIHVHENAAVLSEFAKGIKGHAAAASNDDNDNDNQRADSEDADVNAIIDPDAALEGLSQLKTKEITSATIYRGKLTFGTEHDLSIPVKMVLKTTSMAIPSAKKVSARTAPLRERHQQQGQQNPNQQSSSYANVTAIRKYVPMASETTTAGDTSIDQGNIDDEEVVTDPTLLADAIDERDTRFAYQYGHEYFAVDPTTVADAAKLESSRSLKVITFVRKDAIPRHYFMEQVYALQQDPDIPAALPLFRSFIEGMRSQDTVAIVRFVFRDMMAPKMFVMIPAVKGYALLAKIPYADDIRHLTFPRIGYLTAESVLPQPPTITNQATNLQSPSRAAVATLANTTPRKWTGEVRYLSGSTSRADNTSPSRTMLQQAAKPTTADGEANASADAHGPLRKRQRLNTRNVSAQEAFAAIDDLIDSMDISSTSMHPFNPKSVYSPLIQRMNQCIVHRAVYPERPIPPIDPRVIESLKPNPSIVHHARAAISRIKTAFTITKADESDRTSKLAQVWKRRADEVAAGIAEGGDGMIAEAGWIRLTKLADANTQLADSVTSIDPINDFESMAALGGSAALEAIVGAAVLTLTRLLHIAIQSSAIELMRRIIEKLIVQSPHREYYAKAIDCIESLRRECLVRDLPDSYNTVLKSIKTAIVGIEHSDDREALHDDMPRMRSLDGHLEFWQRLVAACGGSLSLISDTEHAASHTTQQQAQMFFTHMPQSMTRREVSMIVDEPVVIEEDPFIDLD